VRFWREEGQGKRGREKGKIMKTPAFLNVRGFSV